MIAPDVYVGCHAGGPAVHDAQHPLHDCWPCTVRVAYRPRHARRSWS